MAHPMPSDDWPSDRRMNGSLPPSAGRTYGWLPMFAHKSMMEYRSILLQNAIKATYVQALSAAVGALRNLDPK